MTNLPSMDRISPRTVLLSHGLPREGPRWLCDVDDVFGLSGLVVCRAHTDSDAIRRVEEGGLAAAVLIEDQWRIDGLSLLRIIRSIDVDLPCWLVTENTTRRTLEAALALSAAGVITPPRDATEFTRVVKKVLYGPNREN